MASSDNLLWMQNPDLANAMRRRQEGAALMRQGVDSSPIQSPWQGVSRLAQALLGGYEARKGDEEIKGYGERRRKDLADIYAGAPAPAAVGAALSAPEGAAPVSPVQSQALPAPGAGGSDDDLLVRTVFGEARGETPLGQQAVAAVIRNRATASGKPIRDVVMAPNQFEPWNNPQTRAQLEALDPNSPEYKAIAQAVLGSTNDPTGGATHFYAPKAQAALGRPAPSWAQGEGRDIGNHRFYNLPYGGGGGGGAAPGLATPVAAGGGQGAPAAPPQAAPQAPQPGGPGTASFHMDRAQRLQTAGFHQEAQMEMQQAQMAQQRELSRAPQPKNPIQVVDPNDPSKTIWVMPDAAVGQRAPDSRAVTNITMPPQTQTGPIPPGYQLVQQDGGLRMMPIPGGPADRKDTKESNADAAKAAGAQRSANIVTEDIDRTIKLLDTAILPVTGAGASFLSGVAGTAASDASKLLDSIKANIGFDKLAQMRSESPTGAALGAVSDKEMALLQSVLGSLDQAQSPKQFKENLTRLRTLYMDTIHGPGKWKEVAPSETTPTAAPTQGGGWSIRPAP